MKKEKVDRICRKGEGTGGGVKSFNTLVLRTVKKRLLGTNSKLMLQKSDK